MPGSELGAFIRSRRESVSPADVGLPTGSRRRTPGLRRSELATIAGVSVDYLIRLEQGRDRNPSPSVVSALADALGLGYDDRVRLQQLAAITQNQERCMARPRPATQVRPSVADLLGRLAATPAIVLNDVSDLLAWTPAYESIGGPLGVLDWSPPNLLRFTFGDARARWVYPDWERVADDLVGDLRYAYPLDDLMVEGLVAELKDLGGDAFRQRWLRCIGSRTGTGVSRMIHPDVGELRLAFETTTLSDEATQRLVLFFPADGGTADRLDQLGCCRPERHGPVTNS